VPLGPKFVEFHVRPLADDQVERFVRDCSARPTPSCTVPHPRPSEGQAIATNCWDPGSIRVQAGHIRELCSNPLLLTILCIVFHEKRKLPRGGPSCTPLRPLLLEYWRRDIYKSTGTKLEAYDAKAAQSYWRGRLVDAQDNTAVRPPGTR